MSVSGTGHGKNVEGPNAKCRVLMAKSWKLKMDALLHITTLHYIVLGAALFVLGVIGVLTRRNVVIVLMSIELILNAVNLNLVAFSRYWQGLHGPSALHGQVFAIFVITDAAAEAAVGLGILIAFFRNKETVNIDEVNLLKW
jgi:NADH-quinone oxidoreductase subunit K